VKGQSYSNHKRYIPGFHFVLFFLGLTSLVGSIFFLIRSYMHGIERVASIVAFISAVNFIILYFYSRGFVTTVQDRAIRAEENLRYFALTGSMLDPRLTMQQIVALRFAPDLELVGLVNRAITENLSNNEIKKAIKNWKPDLNRV
jgi:hypothetical protein